MRRTPVLVSLALLVSCNSVHKRLSSEYLTPPRAEVVEPGSLGLDAEWFEIESGEGSQTGWFLPSGRSGGHTVLLFHDFDDDVSTMHPYYRFLVEAGMNVCVYDYRGFGGSGGEPSLRSVFMDAEQVVDFLTQRPDVDAAKLAYYGIGFGCSVAVHVARRHTPAALVLENALSIRQSLNDHVEQNEAVSKTMAIGFVEYTGLPEGTEAAENAAFLTTPSLWINGAEEQPDRLRSALAAFYEMGGDKQLWLLPETGKAPHSLLTHDGEYQRAVASFLRNALAGTPERLALELRKGPPATGGGTWWEVDVKPEGLTQKDGRWAVQIGAIDAKAVARYENAWIDSTAHKVRVRMPDEPQMISAMRLVSVRDDEEDGFHRVRSPLTEAGRWMEAHAEQIDLIREGRPELHDIKRMAQVLAEYEESAPLPPLANAELADVFANMGIALLRSKDATDRAHGSAWLKRAVHSVPEQPNVHYWPGRPRTVGFPQRAAVQRARRALAGDAVESQSPLD
jgi:hypothetical protein